MYNILCSLHYLHSANIMHRDIKPTNILIDYNCRAKLCDFGLARKRPDVNRDRQMEKYLNQHPVLKNLNDQYSPIKIMQKDNQTHEEKMSNPLSPK